MADTGSQGFVTIDPQGRITYQFAGHIHAQGLDIDAGTVLSPPTESRVRWIQTANGVVAADVYGLSAFGLDGQVYVRAYANGDVAFAAIEAQDYNLDPLGYGARLEVQSFPAGAVPKRRVGATLEPETGGDPIVSATFLDSKGGTDFCRKVYDSRLLSPAASFTVPWPAWARRLQVVTQGVCDATDPNNWVELAAQLDGYGGAAYYVAIQNIAAGVTRYNGATWATIGYLLGAGVDANIPSLVITEFDRPMVNGSYSPMWHSTGQLWLPGVGFDAHRSVGMCYANANNATYIVLSLVNSARNASKNFATDTRVRAYGFP